MNSDKVLELVDGIWPTTETYIQCNFPHLNPTDDAGYVNLAALIENRLSEGVCEWDAPSRQAATRTISALRRYADYLHQNFVIGQLAYDEEDAIEEFERISLGD